MVSCSGESVKAVVRRKGFWRSREDTLLLISQYREHEKLFRNVNCKTKSVWELITASMTAENPNFSAQLEQVEGKWKSLTLAFRKCCDHNSIWGNDGKELVPFTGKLQSSMVTGLMFACMRQAAALGRHSENLVTSLSLQFSFSLLSDKKVS